MVIKVILFLVIYIVIGIIFDLCTLDSDEDIALSIICVVMWPAIFVCCLLTVIVAELYERLRRKR